MDCESIIDKVKTTLLVVCVTAFVLGCMGMMILSAAKSEKEFQEHLATEFRNCTAKGESEYTCKTYINSLDAKRSADIASIASGVAVGVVAGSVMINAGKK